MPLAVVSHAEIVAESPCYFPSARDAIDAVSAFEAASLYDWEYRIETNGQEWRVHVNNLTTYQRGYIRPSAFALKESA